MLEHFILGFVIQFTTSLGDTIARIPVSARLSRRRKGKFAFSTGAFLAITASIFVAFIFAGILEELPHTRYISAGVVLILSGIIYFDVFKGRFRQKAEKKMASPLSTERFFKLLGIGFLVSSVLVADNTIAIAPLFINTNIDSKIAAVIGIVLATILQVIIVIRSAEKIQKLPHKKEITTISLVILSVLIFIGVV
ncbi:MAG: hypothetical protein R3251_01720 [Candidatus Spechtbacterales bacterium]|nr:hypothetical protein [Candidatus Spechtbacterales bacterium]